MLQILRKLPCIGRSASSYLDGQAIEAKASATVSIRRIATPSDDAHAPEDRFEATRIAPKPKEPDQHRASRRPQVSRGFSEHHAYWERSWRPKRTLLSTGQATPNA